MDTAGFGHIGLWTQLWVMDTSGHERSIESWTQHWVMDIALEWGHTEVMDTAFGHGHKGLWTKR